MWRGKKREPLGVVYLPKVQRGGQLLVSARGPALLAVRRVTPPMQRHRRHDLRIVQAAADDLVLAIHLLTQTKNNVSALELKRHLGVSYAAAWLVKH